VNSKNITSNYKKLNIDEPKISEVPKSQVDNPRANTTQKKYQKQIEWRRNKVRELLIRGYSQYEISNILHMSQPTISRDVNSIYQDKKKRQQKYGSELFLDVQNTLAGLAELIKKLGRLWMIQKRNRKRE
jgi:hypothetical protein